MEKRKVTIRKPVMVDRAVNATLLNRYVAYCEEVQYDISSKANNHKVIHTKRWYQIQWANIKADFLGFFTNPFAPTVASRIAWSLVAFIFIALRDHEKAHYTAFQAPMVFGAITYDTAGQSSHSGEPTTITVTVTIGSGSDRLVTANYSGLGGGLSATFDGSAMQDIITQSPAEAAYYLNPGTGSKNIVVSGGNIKTLGVVSFTGVDQTDPIGTAVRENGTASPNDMTMTTVQNGSVRVDFLGANRDDSTSPTASLDAGTLRCNPVTPQNQFRIGVFVYTNDVASAGSNTRTWTTTGTSRYYLAYEIRAAISGYTVLTLRPNGAGNEMQWDAEGGDYTRVDDVTSDGDTTRLYTPTDNRRAVFGLENHGSETGTIFGVRVNLMMKGLDDIENTVRASIRTNSTNYESPDLQFKNNTYHVESYLWLTNPNTGSAWTWSEIDALQAGMYRVTGGGQAVTQVYVEVLYSTVTIDDKPVTDSATGADALGILALIGISDSNTGAAFSNGYGYRKSITVDNTKVAGSSDFTDFPILIKSTDDDLKSEANGGKVKNGTHLDVRFELGDGTQLKHEIESYNATTGAIVAHVKIPTLGATADTTIYMYFGKNIVATEQDPTAVWNSGYLAVYHLNGNLNDSTANALHLTASGATDTTGFHAGGRLYDGTNDKDYRSHSAIMDITETTLEALVRPDATLPGGERGIISHTHYNLIQNDTADLRMEVNTVTGGYTGLWAGASTPKDGTTWSHVAGSYNKTNLRTFIEGVQQSTTAKTTDIVAGTFDLNVGLHSAGYYKGAIDEVRVHSVGRSNDYILTSRNTLKDPATFYTLGSTVSGGVDPDAVVVENVDTTTEKNVTDSGSGSDAVSLLAQIAIAETAAGVDTVSILAFLSIAETGNATDSVALLALIPIAESATGADTINVAVFVPIADSGSGTETIVILASVSVSETGSGADEIDAEQTADVISISETATGVDAVSVLAQLGISDSATASDVLNILALLGIGDTGSGNDQNQITAMVNISETATATELVQIFAQIGITEQASAIETLSILVQAGITDSATANDVIGILATVDQQETGQGSDQLGITAQVSIPETGEGTDELGALGFVNVADNAQGVDVESIFAFLNINDSGHGVDVPIVVATGTLNLIKTVLKTNKKHTVLRQKMHSVILKQRKK